MLFKNTAEVKSFCGTLNASTKWVTLSGYVESAEQKYIIPMIGQPLYDYIDALYNDTPPLGPEDSKLLKAIQRPLAFYTMLELFPYMLANVGDAGISEPTGQNLTGINQWKYFQTLEKYCSDGDLFLETLLQFLENAPAIDYPDWTDSDAQKAARGLIINSAATLANYAAVAQSRRAFLLLRPFIQRCELQYIRPMLGVVMFDSLKASILGGTLSADQKILIDQYLSPLLVSYTFKDALHKLAFQFSGIGVRFLSDSDAIKQRLAADPIVVGGQVENYRQDAERLFNETKRFLEANPTLYPDYEYPLSETVLPAPDEPLNDTFSPSFGF
jgi:hypothetical protein